MTGRVEKIGRATLIYGLCDAAGDVRYVGKTVTALNQRLHRHRCEAKRRQLPVSRWLRKHPEASINLIETVPAGEDWAERERYWIAKLGGPRRLLNLTTGGEGLAGLPRSPIHKARIAASLRKGATFSCQVCGDQFYRKPYAIARGQNRFCSRQCSNRRPK